MPYYPPSGGGSPSGAAGGDLGGSYPNPTVVSVADVTTGVLAPANGGSGVANTGNLTWPSGGGTAALLGAVQTFSAANTFSVAGAASTSAVSFTGVPFAGTGTTATPLVYINGGAAPTTFSVNGTALGINLPPASTASFLDFHVNGGPGVFSVSSGGAVVSVSTLQAAGITSTANTLAGPTGILGWNGRASLTSPAAGSVQLGAADTNPAVAQTLRSQGATGSNIAGQNWTDIVSPSTGSGVSGDRIFQTGGTGAGAAVQNTPITALTIKGVTQAVVIAKTLNYVNVAVSTTAPTIASGFGVGASVPANNGTAAFTINVGTGGVAATGVITMPTATNGWMAHITNLTSISATVTTTKVTATTQTSMTIGNFSDISVSTAWNASDVLQIMAVAY